jgi:hypothetical protein
MDWDVDLRLRVEPWPLTERCISSKLTKLPRRSALYIEHIGSKSNPILRVTRDRILVDSAGKSMNARYTVAKAVPF